VSTQRQTRGFERHAGRRTTLRFWGGRTGAPEPVAYGTHPALEEPLAIGILSCPPVKWVDRCWTELELGVLPADGSHKNASRTLLTASQQRAVRAPRLSPLHKLVLQSEMRSASAAAGRAIRARSHPSTGAVAVHIALALCDRVSIYGFGNASCYAKASFFGRYYDRTVGLKNYLRELARHHDYEAQHLWLRGLVTRGAVVDPERCFS